MLPFLINRNPTTIRIPLEAFNIALNVGRKLTDMVSETGKGASIGRPYIGLMFALTRFFRFPALLFAVEISISIKQPEQPGEDRHRRYEQNQRGEV